jgi:aryl-alcohol dehydrogenase-like predicted oxidoreductase/histidinol phosphatase-like enzyme
MRLSTARDRDDTRAFGVLHAALDAGVTLLDTANAYCHDSADTGHNERLIARALSTWTGDASKVQVATKGGLTRPDGRWEPDGRARALTSACEASLRALGIDRIPLYQLHAPDPRVPLATSLRALDALKRRGLVEAVGLCNVTVGQIEDARRITEIASVQVELSLWYDGNVLSGVVGYCVTHAIPLLAYRPLGGPEHRRRIEADPVLATVAADHDATPYEIALAALADLSPVVHPLPGPTRTETARSVARAARIALTDDERARLRERFPTSRAMHARSAARVSVSRRSEDGEIVLVMGLPGAGKSTVARQLVAEGYTRVNRDELGGSLNALLPLLDRAIQDGTTRLVLDNTYVTRKARGAVIQAAGRRGLPVRCIWVSTGIEDAQVNAATRIVSRYGRLLGPEELKNAARKDEAAFPPAVQFRYQRELEPPDPAEGFARIEEVTFERRHDPSLESRAVIVWCDGVIQRSRAGRRTPCSPDDLDVPVERSALLRRYAADGWRVLGLSWLPEIAETTMTAADADAIFARLRELLGVAIEVEYCPHAAGPPVCWCRKPLPGLGVVFQQRHRLDPSKCLYVGAGAQDPGFARRLGFQYRDAEGFFGKDN